MSDPLIGMTLGGVTIQRKIGEGGMAPVYVGIQESMRREVAIKIIRREMVGDDEKFVKRFKREASTIAQLGRVQHILPVFNFGEEQGYLYLIMQLASGTLRSYLKSKPLLEWFEIADILNQIATALDYAHQNGVVHRDLKPSNILLDDQNMCLLSDFGIAWIPEPETKLTAEGGLLGTPSYMAPEQCCGEKITPQTDIYALGILLYEMLVDALPFNGNTPTALFLQHCHEQPIPPSELRPGLPKAIDAVILRALEKDPKKRYESAAEMAEAFKKALEGISPEAPTIPLYPTKRARVRNIRVRLIALVVVLIGLITVFALQALPALNLDCAEYNEAGLEYLRVSDYDSAIQEFDHAIQVDAECASAYFNLGVAYEERFDLDQAQAAYETALETDDQLLMARYRLAELLLDKGEIESGFQVIDIGVRMLQLGNINIDETTREKLTFLLYSTRGRAYYLKGDYNLAQRDLEHAIVYQDTVTYPAAPHYYLALVYKATQDDESAYIEWLDTIAFSDSDNTHHSEWVSQAQEAISQHE